MLAIEAYPDESKESYLKLLNFLKDRGSGMSWVFSEIVSTYF